MKTIFAVTFILVMGVGCGKEETPQKPEAATKQAELTEMEKFAEELVRNARIQREKALVLGEKERADLFLDMATNQLDLYDKAFEIAEKENLSTDKNATTTAAPKAKKPEPPKAVPVNIANPIVEKAIRKELKKPTGELTKADLEKVTELELDGKQLTDVTDLEKLSQLKSLHLPHNKLTDVKGLEKLTQLKELVLDDNQLTDVKGLKNLTKLEGLWLPRNRLTDVKGLEKLTRLTELDLGDNSDLTKAQIAKLQKALPNCTIVSNPTK